MDADAWAINQVITNMLGGIEEDNETYPDVSKNYSSQETRAFFTACFSIWSLFRLFGELRAVYSNNEDVISELYPPVRMRQWLCVGVVYELVKRDKGEALANDFLKMIQDIMLKSEQAVAIICNSEPDYTGITELTEENGQRHLNQILNHWNEVVRPALIPFSHASDLP